jgi:hypothetical protein
MCNYGDNGMCIICDQITDTCGDDKACDDCNNEFCRECYNKYYSDKTFRCPVCSCDIITDDMIIDFLFNKYKLTRDKVIDMIKRDYNKKHNIKVIRPKKILIKKVTNPPE